VLPVIIVARAFAIGFMPPPEILAVTWAQGPNGWFNNYAPGFYDPHRSSMLVGSSIGYSQELALAAGGIWSQQPRLVRSGSTVHDPLRRRWLTFIGGSVWEQAINGSTDTPLVTNGPMPSTGLGVAMFDPVRNRVIYFVSTSEVWQLDLTGTPTWSMLTTSGTPPPTLSGNRIAYDPIGDRIVGVVNGNTLTSLTLAGTPAWNSVAIAGTYSAREEMVCDTRSNRLVFFGGYGVDNFGQLVWYQDTWSVSLGGAPQWTQLSTQAPFHGRNNCSFIHDPVNDRLVVYSGHWDSISPHNMIDTWFGYLGTVTAPDLRPAPPGSVSFGTVVGQPGPFTRTLDVSNVGNATSVVFAIVSNDPSVTVDATAFALSAGGTRTLTFTWAPSGLGPLSTSIEIESNDPAHPTRIIPVTGESTVGVGPRGALQFGIVPATANPAPGRVGVTLTLPVRATAEVTVLDVRGSTIRTLASGGLPAGPTLLEWDGLDRNGRAMGSGVYFVRAASRGEVAKLKIALLH
jgi:hypothetical protein